MTATRKNQRVANDCGGFEPPEMLERLLADPAYDTAAVARAMGVSLARFNWAMAQPDPLPERPLNWTANPGVGISPYNPGYVGVTAIAYSYGGYTFGPPVYANL
jgi:hypothetical protein